VSVQVHKSAVSRADAEGDRWRLHPMDGLALDG